MHVLEIVVKIIVASDLICMVALCFFFKRFCGLDKNESRGKDPNA